MSGKLGDKAPLEVLKYALESGQRRWNYGRNLYMEVLHISATFVFQIEGNQKHNIYTSEFYSEKTGQPAQISHKIETQDYKPPVFKNEIETCKATTCFNYAQGQITSSAKDGTCAGQKAVINKVSYQVVKERWQIFDGQGSMINISVPYKTRELVELHQELSPCQSKASALQESGILRPKN
jgi:hypothetical protein